MLAVKAGFLRTIIQALFNQKKGFNLLSLTTKFTPFRMILARREPVELMIEITNNSKEETNASIAVQLGNRLSLDRVGYKTSDLKRIDLFKPSARKAFYYSIWPKGISNPTEETITIKAAEHSKDYAEIKKETVEKLGLKIQ